MKLVGRIRGGGFILTHPVCIAGNIPGAVLTGALIDASCSLWNEDPQRRFCIRYNVPMASKLILIIGNISKAIFVLFVFVRRPEPAWSYRRGELHQLLHISRRSPKHLPTRVFVFNENNRFSA